MVLVSRLISLAILIIEACIGYLCLGARGRPQTDPAREGGDTAEWTKTRGVTGVGVCARKEEIDEAVFAVEKFNIVLCE